MAVTEAIEAPPAGDVPSASEARLQRNLKIIVTVLGVALFVGLAVVIGRIIYLASVAPAQPAAEITAGAGALRPAFGLQLPAGAQVRSMALSGDRLAVHY